MPNSTVLGDGVGLFSVAEEGIRFHPAFLSCRFTRGASPEAAITRVEQQTRRRVLRLFERREWLPPEAVETMQAWEHDGGFHDALPCASSGGRLAAVQIGCPADFTNGAMPSRPTSCSAPPPWIASVMGLIESSWKEQAIEIQNPRLKGQKITL